MVDVGKFHIPLEPCKKGMFNIRVMGLVDMSPTKSLIIPSQVVKSSSTLRWPAKQ
jgi:hypothetical protein